MREKSPARARQPRLRHAASARRARQPSLPGFEKPAAPRRSRKLETIEDVIADLQERQQQLSALLGDLMSQDAPAAKYAVKLFALHGQNASRLGRLLRDQRALSGQAADGISAAIAGALDELSTELGIKL